MGPGTWTHALLRAFVEAETRSAAAESDQHQLGAGSPAAQGQRSRVRGSGDVSPRVCLPPASRFPCPSPRQAAWPWLLVSGPLGRPSVQLERYSHVVLIAGGIGITAVVPVFEATARGLPLSSPGPFARLLSCQRRAASGVAPGGDGAAGDSVLLSHGGSLSLLWTVSMF